MRSVTSLAEQGTDELGGRWSVLAVQVREHVQLDGLLHELGRTPAAEQRDVLRRIYRLVFPHAFAEESVLWPAIRRVLPDGEDLTLRIEEEHQQINQLVTELEAVGPTDPSRPALLDRLVQLLQEDVRDEEDLALPRLQEALAPQQLRRLGVLWLLVRAVAPTRPHPVVSRRPPGNVLAAAPLTVLDRSRDRVEQLPARSERAARIQDRVDGALRAWSRRVERYPALRTGERAETALSR